MRRLGESCRALVKPWRVRADNRRMTLHDIAADLYSALLLSRDPSTVWMGDLYRELAREKMEVYARETPRGSAPLYSLN